MIGFCKNEECPSSTELLEFQVGELPRHRGSDVRRHLRTCEFCAAEVEFYSHYPQEEYLSDQSEITEIPLPLYQLAEALLKNRNGDSDSLDKLLFEKDGLILDKV